MSLFLVTFTTQYAHANEEDASSNVEAVKIVSQEGNHVALTTEGEIYYSDDENNWDKINTGLTRNKITDVNVVSGKFYATSFFQGVVSSDGKNWSKFTLPLGEKFNPGNILPDDKVFTDEIMSVDAIQSFLDSQQTGCRSGYVCLNTYKETTYDRAANAMCDEYDGGENETAAEIIHKSAAACDISAEVLLIKLQKEQSLITHTFPSQTRYNIAMGYACPDTAPCNTLYYGFYNQVYNAAKQLVRYTNPEGTSNYFTWYPVEKTSLVRWHPNSACGGNNVFIENKATASFYYYTPYQPNTAALTAFSGVGDSCSSYGNRNLWRLYNQWFNVDDDFRTFIAGGAQIFVSVDNDGTVALSSNGTSWVREAASPLRGGEQVNQLYYKDGRFIIGLTNGKGYASLNGKVWGPIGEDEVEDISPTVSLGDTAVEEDTGESNSESNETPAEETNPEEAEETSDSNENSEETTDEERTVASVVHTVAPGDSVWALSSRYSTTVNRIVDLNKLTRGGALIFVGQKLTIETSNTDAVATPQPVEQVEETVEEPSETVEEPVTESEPNNIMSTHTVALGDTVWGLSYKYDVSVAQIVSWNNLLNGGALIFVGQELKLEETNNNVETISNEDTSVDTNSGSEASEESYTVKAGDTLWSISIRYGTTVGWIVAKNKIPNADLIKPGLVLEMR